MNTINLNIDALTPSQNVVDRMNRWKKMELRDFWYWLVKGALGRQKLDLAQWKRETKSVLVLRVSTKLIDDSNVPSGCKYLIDALKNEKLIVDDSRKWVRNSFDQRKTNKGEIPHMEITISSMDE